MMTAAYFTPPDAESLYCDRPDCWANYTRVLDVPDRHRKPGQGAVVALCDDCAELQLQEWDELDEAARADFLERHGDYSVRCYDEKHGA